MNAQGNSHKTGAQAMATTDMHTGQQPDFEPLSALMDGELPAPQAHAAVQLACGDGGSQCWHMYHLIGDVLRAQDLAACARGEPWLAGLRKQLAQPAQGALPAAAPAAPAAQPAAPRPAQAANDDVFPWKMAAGFASFAAVAAIGWNVLGGGMARDGGVQLASTGAATTVVQAGGSAPTAARPATPLVAVALPARTAADGRADSRSDPLAGPAVMLRDPRLDELLAEHRQATGTSALSNASGFLRNATFEGPAR